MITWAKGHTHWNFWYEGARLWNSLDTHFKDVDSLSKFPCESGKGEIVNVMYAFCVCFRADVIVYIIVHPHYHIGQPPLFPISAIVFIVGKKYCVLMFFVQT